MIFADEFSINLMDVKYLLPVEGSVRRHTQKQQYAYAGSPRQPTSSHTLPHAAATSTLVCVIKPTVDAKQHLCP